MVERDGHLHDERRSQRIDLPLVRIAEDLVDRASHHRRPRSRVSPSAQRGELAERLSDLDVDIVASVATMGIPLAHRGEQGARHRRLPDLPEDAEDPPGRRDHRARRVDHDGGTQQMLLFDRERVTSRADGASRSSTT